MFRPSDAGAPEASRPTAFWDQLESFGDQVALITADGRSLTYTALAKLADKSAAPLPGTPRLLVIEATHDVDTLAAYLGALRARHPVLLIPAGKEVALERLLARFKPAGTWRAGASEWLLSSGDTGEVHPHLRLLLPTSGTTGEPKLVRLSHDNIDSNARAIVDYLKLGPSERPIIVLPWHYSYGLSVIHSTLASGGCMVLTDHSIEKPEFWSHFADRACTSFAGVPYCFEMLERAGFLDRPVPPGLRYFTVAGGKLAPDKVAAFARHAAVRRCSFFVMYGQTEASPRMAYLPPDLAADHPECIGLPIPGGELSIVGPDGQLVADGETGELVYRGPNVSMGYALTQADLAKGPELSELRTGDLGVRDSNGLYRITGRASRFSKLFGLRISLDDLETQLRAAGRPAWVAGDDRTIVAWLPDATEGQVSSHELAGQLGIPPYVVRMVRGEDVPRLASGKVDYARILVEGQEPHRTAAVVGEAAVSRRIASLLNRANVDPRSSYVDLGADSLSFVQASLIIEDEVGYVPERWESRPLSGLDELARQPASESRSAAVRQIEPQVWLRALAITCVVASHVGWTQIAGGAFLLLLLSGTAFARFRAPLLCSGRIVAAFAPTLLRILLPYYLIMVVYQVGRADVDLLHWLLLGNLSPTLQIEESILPFYWFIPNLVQSVMLMGALFAVPRYRAAARRDPWSVGVATLAVSFAIALAAQGAAGLSTDQALLAAGHFTTRTPFFLFYIFVFGWTVHFADTDRRRLLLTAIAPLMFATFGEAGCALWLILGSWAVIWLPIVAIPRRAQQLVNAIAASVFTIYIFHMVPIQIVASAWPAPRPILVDLTLLLTAIAIGIAARVSLDLAERQIRRIARRLQPEGPARASHAITG